MTSASSTPIACRRLTDCSPTAIVPPISHAPRRGQIPIEPAAPTVPLLPRSIGSRGCQGPLDVGSGSGQALRSGRVLRSLRRCVCAASEEVRGAIGLRHGVDLRSTGRSLTGQANAATVAPVFIWCDRTARVRRRFKSRCNSTVAALWIRPRRTYRRRSMNQSRRRAACSVEAPQARCRDCSAPPPSRAAASRAGSQFRRPDRASQVRNRPSAGGSGPPTNYQAKKVGQ